MRKPGAAFLAFLLCLAAAVASAEPSLMDESTPTEDVPTKDVPTEDNSGSCGNAADGAEECRSPLLLHTFSLNDEEFQAFVYEEEDAACARAPRDF